MHTSPLVIRHLTLPLTCGGRKPPVTQPRTPRPPAGAAGCYASVPLDLVGPRHLGAPHPIGMLTEPSMRPRLAAVNTHEACAPTARPHEPLDTPATDPVAALAQGSMQTRTPIRAAALLEDRPHRLHQNPVLFPARTRGATAPRLVAGPRHAVQRTEACHRHHPSVRRDERERFGLRSEQNRMAFFRRACSS